MLPTDIRAGLLDKLSVRTMRWVTPANVADAEGIVARTYEQVQAEFFVNGTITSHAACPELLAATWCGGREVVLVTDRLERHVKEAMGASISRLNDCPYCGDMLVSLVHGAGRHDVASRILAGREREVADHHLRRRLEWALGTGAGDSTVLTAPPFSATELPEAIATALVFHYTNRFTHVVMDGSPVAAPLGVRALKRTALRMFGSELATTTEVHVPPGRALALLPPATVPEDIQWAAPNVRVADALARWCAAVDRAIASRLSPAARRLVEKRLARWRGERMPISAAWAEHDLDDLGGDDRARARLALLTALAPYQVDEATVDAVWADGRDEATLVALLAWASLSASRRVASWTAEAARRANVSIGPPATAGTAPGPGFGA